MLDEIRTFVVLAESGSLQRAAERLFLTPSAVTRQIQRLEATLKMPLLDRRVKPGRITREGHAVLDSGRHMLRIMDDLKASSAKDAEPSGVFNAASRRWICRVTADGVRNSRSAARCNDPDSARTTNVRISSSMTHSPVAGRAI